jgi:hypothetical protein
MAAYDPANVGNGGRMKCPECGTEMEPGFIQTPGRLFWTGKPKSMGGLSADYLDRWPRMTILEGWRCRSCCLITERVMKK